MRSFISLSQLLKWCHVKSPINPEREAGMIWEILHICEIMKGFFFLKIPLACSLEVWQENRTASVLVLPVSSMKCHEERLGSSRLLCPGMHDKRARSGIVTGGPGTEEQWQEMQRQVSGVGGKGICPAWEAKPGYFSELALGTNRR